MVPSCFPAFLKDVRAASSFLVPLDATPTQPSRHFLPGLFLLSSLELPAVVPTVLAPRVALGHAEEGADPLLDGHADAPDAGAVARTPGPPLHEMRDVDVRPERVLAEGAGVEVDG